MPSVAVGSGTDALHLAYVLSGIKKNDEVICPIFTCTATNIPLLYVGAKIKFADINPDTLNISIESVKKLITKKKRGIGMSTLVVQKFEAFKNMVYINHEKQKR